MIRICIISTIVKLASPSEQWINPVNGTITSTFGERLSPINGSAETHKGLDIAVPLNTKAVAVKSGVIVDEGYSNSYGYYVKYKTYDDYNILYAHLNELKAKKGQNVEQGEVLAYSGSTGSSTGPHLHYEVRKNEQQLDPAEFYKTGN